MIDKLINKLHPLERKVLPVLDKVDNFDDIVKESGLKDVEVMRALQWLSNKEVLKIKEDLEEVLELGENAKEVLDKGLPEKRFLEIIGGKSVKEGEVRKELNAQEFGVSMGILKKNSAIIISKEKEGMAFKATPAAKFLLKNLKKVEDFLSKKFPIALANLSEEERKVFEELKDRRGFVKLEVRKTKSIELTELGKKLIKSGIKGDVEDKLTVGMLKDGSWKKKKFRGFDVSINVPAILGGRKQHYRRFLDEVRQKFLSLGFIEREGPIVESDFWDMDALYMPQFHSARDIHEAYYIKDPEYAELDEKIVNNVKKAHEDGFGTGSKGWQYKFDTQRTKRNVLRTHDTSICARTLASKDLQIPGKYFQISRCFRYDVIDATHLPDFNQVGGFVIEEGLNLKHLFGLLQMFAKEFADTDEIKLVPAYFPFTEPSVELHAKHPELGWIELGGAGIFRPELTKPLGVNVPVIAWGLGVGRVAMFKLGLKDIRNLYSHDLNILRKTKVNL
ncbi:MAG: phenylalanine--tRNA ligase subunit alpha [Candidatus Woesearchaeota archaeon]